MPASKRKAAPVKKTAAKAPARKAVARPRVVRSSKDESLLTKQFFMKEQEEFYAAHPNSRVLIALFTGALVLFLYIVWSNKLDLFPQAFVW